MTTATLPKPARSPKAVVVSKLIAGKLITELAESEKQKLLKAKSLCQQLASIADWKEEAVAAEMALASLVEKCS